MDEEVLVRYIDAKRAYTQCDWPARVAEAYWLWHCSDSTYAEVGAMMTPPVRRSRVGFLIREALRRLGCLARQGA